MSDIKSIEGLKKYCKNLRNFCALSTIVSKTKAINKFFTDENLDCAVVGLSGGIDSSLVYYMLLHAASVPGSPIKRVQGLFLPIKTPGTTGQDTAKFFYNELINSVISLYPEKFYSQEINLTKAAQAYYDEIHPYSDWGKGQIDSIVRTPALYGYAAKLQELEYKSIVVGTTNRDEGAYIGFFGKASDGMVDLQPIADLHKSEVYTLSRILKVPQEIIDRVPEGNVWNAQIDEDMIGAPYWFLELYQILLEHKATYLISYIQDCPEAVKWALNIESCHTKNLHKYKVGSPARYIDVLQRIIS